LAFKKTAIKNYPMKNPVEIIKLHERAEAKTVALNHKSVVRKSPKTRNHLRASESPS
jgi:hypothetical protein